MFGGCTCKAVQRCQSLLINEWEGHANCLFNVKWHRSSKNAAFLRPEVDEHKKGMMMMIPQRKHDIRQTMVFTLFSDTSAIFHTHSSVAALVLNTQSKDWKTGMIHIAPLTTHLTTRYLHLQSESASVSTSSNERLGFPFHSYGYLRHHLIIIIERQTNTNKYKNIKKWNKEEQQ